MMKRSVLEDEAILNQLEEVAESLGIQVRYEQIKKESSFYPGGLCRVKGEDIIIINSKGSTEDKIQTFAKSIQTYDLSQIFIKPALRELLCGDEE